MALVKGALSCPGHDPNQPQLESLGLGHGDFTVSQSFYHPNQAENDTSNGISSISVAPWDYPQELDPMRDRWSLPSAPTRSSRTVYSQEQNVSIARQFNDCDRILAVGTQSGNQLYCPWQYEYLGLESDVLQPSQQGSNLESSAYEDNGDHRENASGNNLLSCQWKDCKYSGHFATEGTLMRHVDTMHVSRDKFKCTHCGKRFNRKDRYRTHARMVHS